MPTEGIINPEIAASGDAEFARAGAEMVEDGGPAFFLNFPDRERGGLMLEEQAEDFARRLGVLARAHREAAGLRLEDLAGPSVSAFASSTTWKGASPAPS